MMRAAVVILALISCGSVLAADRESFATELVKFKKKWPQSRKTLDSKPLRGVQKSLLGFDASPNNKRLVIVTDDAAVKKSFHHETGVAVAVFVEGSTGAAWSAPIERSHSIDDFNWTDDSSAVLIDSTINFYVAVTLVDVAHQRTILSGAATNGEYRASPRLAHVAYLSALSGDDSDRGTGCAPAHVCGDELFIDGTKIWGRAAPDGPRVTQVRWLSDDQLQFCGSSKGAAPTRFDVRIDKLNSPIPSGACEPTDGGQS